MGSERKSEFECGLHDAVTLTSRILNELIQLAAALDIEVTSLEERTHL
jgi:hypothetical protein